MIPASMNQAICSPLSFGARAMQPAFDGKQRSCYAMAMSADGSAEITMYGEIVNSQPVDPRTGKPLEGNYIIKSEFLKDLQSIEFARKLTIRLDSLGGDAYASLLIYNRLKDLRAEKIVQVDGVAMSGGCAIMCAGDTVKVNPGSLIMVHKSKAWMNGWYSEDDLDQIRQSNITTDKALANVYAAKTGKGEAAMIALMKKQTYLTGKEAIEQGFADELIEEDIALGMVASADHIIQMINSRAAAGMGRIWPEGVMPVSKAASSLYGGRT